MTCAFQVKIVFNLGITGLQQTVTVCRNNIKFLDTLRYGKLKSFTFDSINSNDICELLDMNFSLFYTDYILIIRTSHRYHSCPGSLGCLVNGKMIINLATYKRNGKFLFEKRLIIYIIAGNKFVLFFNKL